MSPARPTRLPDAINPQHASAIPTTTRRDVVPNSQESFVSVASSGFAAGPRLLSSWSNISNSTSAETELTSPTSSNAPSSQSQGFDSSQSVAASPPRPRAQQQSRPIAPPLNTDLRENSTGSGSATATSPMSIDTPFLAPASKRTASGTVKSAGSSSTVESPMRAPVRGGHSRNTSTDSNVSRIGELSAQLKTRLSYAMVKVQNGWEKRTIDELEELPSQRGSPIGLSGRRSLDSPRFAERRRRPSGVSETLDQYMASPSQASPNGISRSLNGTPPSSWRPGSSQPLPQTRLMYTEGNASNAPALAPAADIVSRRNRRSNSTHVPPMLSTQRKYYSDVGAPSTPTTIPRAGILRMPSQQAEKDAVDTLLFMSSPNNSNRLAHTSADAQPSPLRSEFSAAKRVVFENRNGSSSSEPDDVRAMANGSHDAIQKMRFDAGYSHSSHLGESDDEIPLQAPNKR
ncbi:uncharacterized protein BDZ99DRAFT_513180 [Mytilinidion resinicola]|uniref:Cyclin-dependent kinase n=1 Tax=Mytilinidion resinicola TaxID=574789 RepID=A0A6A6Z732_9PEZI|nr:uncharacterized protein BDZ99DRAFT_513180 [Mytilinidion resinicola]KAF2816911.1 hypothetical protein BDZ99DRAFT_513180 [Mytilinidion resinicola]